MSSLYGPAVMSDCSPYIPMEEMGIERTEYLRDYLIKNGEKPWLAHGGSPWNKWYRDQAKPDENGKQYIYWKKSKPYHAKYIFFKTVDTGRLLPLDTALFRLQFFAHKSKWEHLDSQNKKKGFLEYVTVALGKMPEILVLRGFLDMQAADIPILITNWENDVTDAAVDYWARRSHPDWKPTVCERDLPASLGFKSHHLPCFRQSDTCVRALWADPEVGFVPLFIIIFPQGGPDTGQARVIWTHSTHRMPLHLVDTFPQGCGGVDCPKTDCGMFDMSKSRTLHDDSPMLRRQPYTPALLCNSWGCNKNTLNNDRLERCAKCQVVRYCSKEHQLSDWNQHKEVCEKRDA